MGNKEGGTDPMRDKTMYLTWDNIRRIIALCDTERDKVFFLLAVSTGRRVGELRLLRVQDIDSSSGTIVWNIKKKRKEFRILLPLEKEVMDRLTTYIHKEGLTDWVFPSPYNADNPLSKRRWQQILENIVLEAGILTAGGHKPHFHSLRHSVAVRILEQTGDIRLAKRTLQHSNIAITGHYLQVSNRDYKRKMEGVLSV